MNLRELNSGKRQPPLISEYIHEPIPFTEVHWVRAGGLLESRPADREDEIDISLFRDQHCRRLACLAAAKTDRRTLDWIEKVQQNGTGKITLAL
jgi:hypothetical protein